MEFTELDYVFEYIQRTFKLLYSVIVGNMLLTITLSAFVVGLMIKIIKSVKNMRG